MLWRREQMVRTVTVNCVVCIEGKAGRAGGLLSLSLSSHADSTFCHCLYPSSVPLIPRSPRCVSRYLAHPSLFAYNCPDEEIAHPLLMDAFAKQNTSNPELSTFTQILYKAIYSRLVQYSDFSKIRFWVFVGIVNFRVPWTQKVGVGLRSSSAWTTEPILKNSHQTCTVFRVNIFFRYEK